VAERCGISDWSARRNLRIFTKYGLVRQLPQNGRRHTFVRLTGADVEKTVRRNKLAAARKWLDENVRPTDFGLAFCCICAGCKMLAAVGGLA
jgi:S-adenosylmethionine:diacylglycerol 3-amino-3-carboxypropyl transferase